MTRIFFLLMLLFFVNTNVFANIPAEWNGKFAVPTISDSNGLYFSESDSGTYLVTVLKPDAKESPISYIVQPNIGPGKRGHIPSELFDSNDRLNICPVFLLTDDRYTVIGEGCFLQDVSAITGIKEEKKDFKKAPVSDGKLLFSLYGPWNMSLDKNARLAISGGFFAKNRDDFHIMNAFDAGKEKVSLSYELTICDVATAATDCKKVVAPVVFEERAGKVLLSGTFNMKNFLQKSVDYAVRVGLVVQQNSGREIISYQPLKRLQSSADGGLLLSDATKY